jgi:glutamyl-tRNA synthetase
VIKDYIKNDITYNPETIDSFILLNHNKIPMQNFATAVDDMLNNISLVIRDEKYIDNAPKQEHIRNMLNYEKEIHYAHLPTLLNAEEISVKQLLEDGFLPDAIANYLISLGNQTPKAIFTLKESIEWFEIENISASPIAFDYEKLREINAKHLQNLDAKELSRYVGFADESIGNLAKVYLNEISTTKELREKISAIFASKEIPSDVQESAKILKAIIKDAPHFEEYDEFKNYIIKESSLEEETITSLLRLLLTGTNDGIDIVNIYKYLKNYLGEIIK